MDGERTPYAYDPKIGEEAYAAQADAIDRVDPLAISTPNVDPSLAAIVATNFVEDGKRGTRRAAFESLAPHLGEHTLDELDQRANAFWFLHLRAHSAEAVKTDVKVDPALIAEGMEAKARAITLLEYHLAKNTFMMAELADIRSGTGVVDLTLDLGRLATHLSVHKAVIEGDKLNYTPGDEQRLRGLANQIRAALKKDGPNETFDLRNRAWTRMVETYGELKAAADFLFRHRPTDLAAFQPLRTAVLALGSRSKPAAEPPIAPAGTTPVVPTTAPTAPAAPAVEPPPGFPGGNPLT